MRRSVVMLSGRAVQREPVGTQVMGEGFQFVDIIFFALLAGFLVFRLRGVLGRRTGEERQRPNPFAVERTGQGMPDNVIPMPDRNRPAESRETAEEPYSLAAGLARIKAADPAFDEKHFVQGVRGAFEVIVMGYARGDTAALRPLLSDEVYDSFAEQIRKRTVAGETHDTRIERIQDVDLTEARLDGRTALVTVRIVTDQIDVSRDAAGTVLDGDPEHPVEVVDIWTFSRNTRSQDPNWLLVETRTPH